MQFQGRPTVRQQNAQESGGSPPGTPRQQWPFSTHSGPSTRSDLNGGFRGTTAVRPFVLVDSCSANPVNRAFANGTFEVSVAVFTDSRSQATLGANRQEHASSLPLVALFRRRVSPGQVTKPLQWCPCRNVPRVRLNGSLRQEKLDGAAQPRPTSGAPLKGEVLTGTAFDKR